MILIYSLHPLNTLLSAQHFTSYRVQSVDSPYKVGLKSAQGHKAYSKACI